MSVDEKTVEQISDWQLEQYVLAELPPEKMAFIAECAKKDSTLYARITAINVSNTTLMQAMSPMSFAKVIENSKRSEQVSAQNEVNSQTSKLSDFVQGLVQALNKLVKNPQGMTAFASVTALAVISLTMMPQWQQSSVLLNDTSSNYPATSDG
jgi:hypothetical protein